MTINKAADTSPGGRGPRVLRAAPTLRAGAAIKGENSRDTGLTPLGHYPSLPVLTHTSIATPHLPFPRRGQLGQERYQDRPEEER